MFLFREEEQRKLLQFAEDDSQKAMAIYGRRRCGKTELITHLLPVFLDALYFQVPGNDYAIALSDFKREILRHIGTDSTINSLSTFQQVFGYLSKTLSYPLTIIIDDFPYLARKNETVPEEFQRIIDHSLNSIKLILTGSNVSFMNHQILDENAPLYGRFDEVIRLSPFTFTEIRSLYPDFDDAMTVYALTGGAASYVMLFRQYSSVQRAVDMLYFSRGSILLQEAPNILRQPLKDITTYVTILRAIGQGELTAQKIASFSQMDGRGIYTYLNKLIELEIVAEVKNPLSSKPKDKRYQISDLFFRFIYTYIEPNRSLITTLGPSSKETILSETYPDYLSSVYRDLIRGSIHQYIKNAGLSFVPDETGKWWGNILENGRWHETDLDLIAMDDENVIIGDCKYRSTPVLASELDRLKYKAQFIPAGDRTITYLLAGKSGFEDALLTSRENLILIRGSSLIRKDHSVTE